MGKWNRTEEQTEQYKASNKSMLLRFFLKTAVCEFFQGESRSGLLKVRLSVVPDVCYILGFGLHALHSC